jgi:hypothetical protein
MSPGGKGGRCVGVTILPPSYADCLEITGASTSGARRVSLGLYMDSTARAENHNWTGFLGVSILLLSVKESSLKPTRWSSCRCLVIQWYYLNMVLERRRFLTAVLSSSSVTSGISTCNLKDFRLEFMMFTFRWHIRMPEIINNAWDKHGVY